MNDYQWKLNRDGNVDKHHETPIKKDDDAVDALMYVFREMVDRNPPERDDAMSRMQVKFKMMRNRSVQRQFG